MNKNVYFIRCPRCGGECELYMLDTINPAVRPSTRIAVSEDGEAALQLHEAGEWVHLRPFWASPEEVGAAADLVSRFPCSIPPDAHVWCSTCGEEDSFSAFDSEDALVDRQTQLIQAKLRGVFPSKRRP
jgi:hypothetical protein